MQIIKLVNIKLYEEQVTKLKKILTAIKTNGDGQITKQELKSFLSKLEETVEDGLIDEMIKIAKVNGNGEVDFN